MCFHLINQVDLNFHNWLANHSYIERGSFQQQECCVTDRLLTVSKYAQTNFMLDICEWFIRFPPILTREMNKCKTQIIEKTPNSLNDQQNCTFWYFAKHLIDHCIHVILQMCPARKTAFNSLASILLVYFSIKHTVFLPSLFLDLNSEIHYVAVKEWA